MDTVYRRYEMRAMRTVVKGVRRRVMRVSVGKRHALIGLDFASRRIGTESGEIETLPSLYVL